LSRKEKDRGHLVPSSAATQAEELKRRGRSRKIDTASTFQGEEEVKREVRVDSDNERQIRANIANKYQQYTKVYKQQTEAPQ